MDKTTFEKIINMPSNISPEEAVLLEELAQEFPYCQMAHLLIANESYQKKSMHYPKKLRKASTYILDRTVLHSLLHNKVKETQVPDISVSRNEASNEEAVEDTETENTIVSLRNVEILKELEQNLTELKKKKEEFKSTSNQIDPSPERIETALETKQLSPNSYQESKFGEELNQEENQNIDLLLEYLKTNHNSSIEKNSLNTKKNQIEIIDKFIEAQPKLSPRSSINVSETENPDLSVESTELKLDLITENYAMILTKQNKIEKAIEVYKKLLLKYPDKSAYFAVKLNELESR